MKQTSKLWLGLGVCATVSTGAVMLIKGADSLDMPLIQTADAANPAGSEAGEKGPSTAGGEAGEKGEGGAFTGEGDFPGDFNKALEKLMAGEGGESGLGLTKMWPRVSAPALTGTQIDKVIRGNTVHSNDHHAFHFNANGTIEGWSASWAKLSDASKCPRTEVVGDPYFYWDGICYGKTVVPASGTWTIREHQLCAVLEIDKEDKQPCWHVALLLDRVALFDSTGKLEGKGNTLKAGKVLAQLAY